jgi:8-oxo-dGTP pyrophosphatase MutT (NUDIX family)
VSEPGLRERPTVRVVLLDPDGRILLMKGRFKGGPSGGAWFAIGGGAEPGETVEETALREVAEETGFTEIELGQVVWRRGGPLTLPNGERVMMREAYLVARCAGGEPSREGWDEVERNQMLDLRWWSVGELSATAERIYPARLADLLADILAGRLPLQPLELPWD